MADDRKIFEKLDEDVKSIINKMDESISALTAGFDKQRDAAIAYSQATTNATNKRKQEIDASEKLRKNTLGATDLIDKLNKSTRLLGAGVAGAGASAKLLGLSSSTANDTIIKLAKLEKLKGSAVEKSTQKLIQVAGDYQSQSLELARTKTALGNFGNSMLGRIQLQNKESQLAKAELAVTAAKIKQIEDAIAAQDQLTQKAIEDKEKTGQSIAAMEQSIRTVNEKIHAASMEAKALKDLTAQHIAKKASLETEVAQIQAIIQSDQVRKAELENSTAAQRAHTEMLQQRLMQESDAMRATKDGVDAKYSELVAIQNRAQQISEELNNENLTAQQRSALQSMHARELEQLSQKERLLEEEIKQSELQLVSQQAQIEATSGAWRASQSALFENEAQLAKVNRDLEASGKQLQSVESSISQLDTAIKSSTEGMQRQLNRVQELEELNRDNADQLGALQQQYAQESKAIDDSIRARGTLVDEYTTAAEKLKTDQQNALNKEIQKYKTRVSDVADVVKKVSDGLNKLVDTVRKTQQQFGLSAGTAAKVKFENLSASIKSYTESLASGGRKAAVSVEEIEAAQSAFQSEFGGVLTSGAAADIAQQAKEMGVGAGELAKARRVFMTQTMGDTGQAKAAQDKFVAEFAKKGLTSKDAMQAIGANSELLARNGTRFAVSFARAAAEAKKIGVDLGKIDQVGDNIIGDFEGFLEGQAELGAMGFNFDSSRLAEVAESGDTGALMEELRSQLASQGKDLTKLRRSEQLALSKSFGISMEELQRMAAPPGADGSGEKTLDPAELQKDANASLTKLVNLGQVAGVTLGLMATTLTFISKNLMAQLGPQLATKLFPGFSAKIMGTAVPPVQGPPLPPSMGGPPTTLLGRAAAGVRSVGSGIGSAAKSLVSPVSQSVKIGGSALAGLFGAVEGFSTAKKEGKDTATAAGAGTVQGGLAAAGTALGAAFGGPLGMMIGGFLGNTLGKGLNKYAPELADGIGKVFSGIGKAFEPVKNAFKRVFDSLTPLKDSFMSLFSVFTKDGGKTSQIGETLGKVLSVIGTVIGTVLMAPLNGLAIILRIISGGFTLLFDTLSMIGKFIDALGTGDYTAVKEAWNKLLDNLVSTIKDVAGSIVEPFTNIFKSITGKLPDWAKSLLGVGDKEKTPQAAQPQQPEGPGVMARMGAAIGGWFKGDDVVSQSGYGKRSLVTPSGVIALNNKDNVIAYADDLMGTQRLPYGSIAEEVSSIGPLIQSLFERGTKLGGGKGLNSMAHLGKVATGTAGMGKYDFLPRTVSTLFGNVGKFGPSLLKFAAQNAKAIPILGSLIGAGFTGYDEYKQSGSMGRALGKGAFSAIGGTLGSIGGAGLSFGNPIISSLAGMGGSLGGEALFNAIFGSAQTGDDVVSKPGYGNRALVTPSGTVPINNKDNVIAYADDMISTATNPLKLLAYGALGMTPPQDKPATTQPTADFSKLEAKLDQVVNAISRMNVEMDGQKVGRILVGRTDSATAVGVMRRG